jgi:predicted ester cyclase
LANELRKSDLGRLAGVGVADVVRGYVSALNDGDVDAVLEHVAVDFVSEHTSALGESFTGRDEYRSRLPKFFALLPERHYEIEDVIVDGQRAACRTRCASQECRYAACSCSRFATA